MYIDSGNIARWTAIPQIQKPWLNLRKVKSCQQNLIQHFEEADDEDLDYEIRVVIYSNTARGIEANGEKWEKGILRSLHKKDNTIAIRTPDNIDTDITLLEHAVADHIKGKVEILTITNDTYTNYLENTALRRQLRRGKKKGLQKDPAKIRDLIPRRAVRFPIAGNICRMLNFSLEITTPTVIETPQDRNAMRREHPATRRLRKALELDEVKIVKTVETQDRATMTQPQEETNELSRKQQMSSQNIKHFKIAKARTFIKGYEIDPLMVRLAAPAQGQKGNEKWNQPVGKNGLEIIMNNQDSQESESSENDEITPDTLQLMLVQQRQRQAYIKKYRTCEMRKILDKLQEDIEQQKADELRLWYEAIEQRHRMTDTYTCFPVTSELPKARYLSYQGNDRKISINWTIRKENNSWEDIMLELNYFRLAVDNRTTISRYNFIKLNPWDIFLIITGSDTATKNLHYYIHKNYIDATPLYTTDTPDQTATKLEAIYKRTSRGIVTCMQITELPIKIRIKLMINMAQDKDDYQDTINEITRWTEITSVRFPEAKDGVRFLIRRMKESPVSPPF